jgi:hypothetical protein
MARKQFTRRFSVKSNQPRWLVLIGDEAEERVLFSWQPPTAVEVREFFGLAPRTPVLVGPWRQQ